MHAPYACFAPQLSTIITPLIRLPLARNARRFSIGACERQKNQESAQQQAKGAEREHCGRVKKMKQVPQENCAEEGAAKPAGDVTSRSEIRFSTRARRATE